MPIPTRNGFKSDGWFTAATGGTAVSIDRVYQSNETIFARWSQVTSSYELVPDNTLRAWVRNETLHVTGLTAGELLFVYSVSGTLIYQSVATSNETDIPLRVQGVYIVKAGDNTVKVVNE